jgi:hypothetical protein
MQVGQLASRHLRAGADIVCFCETDFVGRLEIDALQLGFITSLNAFGATEEHGEAGVEIRTIELPAAPRVLLNIDWCQRVIFPPNQ